MNRSKRNEGQTHSTPEEIAVHASLPESGHPRFGYERACVLTGATEYGKAVKVALLAELDALDPDEIDAPALARLRAFAEKVGSSS